MSNDMIRFLHEKRMEKLQDPAEKPEEETGSKMSEDFGDVEIFFNVFNFFVAPTRMVDDSDVIEMQGLISDLAYEMSPMIEKHIKTSLKGKRLNTSNKAILKGLLLRGFKVKK